MTEMPVLPTPGGRFVSVMIGRKPASGFRASANRAPVEVAVDATVVVCREPGPPPAWSAGPPGDGRELDAVAAMFGAAARRQSGQTAPLRSVSGIGSPGQGRR